MSATIVVMVLEQDDSSRGEIKVMRDPGEAARLAEDLIESGVEIERIRIFDATELAMKVSHKPVVSLGAEAPYEAPPPPAEEDLEPVAVRAGAANDDSSEDEQSLSDTPFVQNGVRFSSLFKSDDV
jgi:hypothetical protein